MVFPLQGRSIARALPPALVLVFLGANDAVAPGKLKHRRVHVHV